MTVYEKLKRLCHTSLFISMIMRLVNVAYDGLRDGFFGRMMTAYPEQEKLFHKGLIGSFFSKRGTFATKLRQIRLRLAVFFEKSALLDLGLKKATYLLGCSLRVYGIFLLAFGGYTIVIYYIKLLAFPGATHEIGDLIWGTVCAVLAIPMIGSRHSVAELLQKGILLRALLIDIFGIPEDRFDISGTKRGGKYYVALLLGMFVGVLTMVIPPQMVVLFMIGILGLAVVMCYPEVGVLALIVLTPILSYLSGSFRTLELGIALTSIAYLGKLIRGKRVFHLSLIDVMVVLFGGLILLSGIVSVGGSGSARRVWQFCLCMLMYFMIVNLIRTPAWIHRAVLAGVGSAVLMAVIGVFQYFYGDAEMVQSMFGTSNSWLHMTAIWESSASSSIYLMLFLPLLLAILMTASKGKSKIVALGCVCIILTSLILTFSKFAWIGALAALLLFFLIYSRKTVCWLLLLGLSVPIWNLFLPDNWFGRVFAIADMTHPMTYERVRGWQGTVYMLQNHLLGGIGYGTEAFREVYPRYSLSGLEYLETPDQLYLSLLCAFGILGLSVFIIVMVVFSQHCFHYIGNPSENYSRTFVAAGFSAVMGALVAASGCDIWFDSTVFLTFFIVLALTCAYIRAGNLIRMRNQDVSGTDVSHAHVDLHFEV